MDVVPGRKAIWTFLLASYNQHIKFNNDPSKLSRVIIRKVFLPIFKMAAIAVIFEVKSVQKTNSVFPSAYGIVIYNFIMIP